eukprot:3753210-Pleurochrysis_carterae.AAC.1
MARIYRLRSLPCTDREPSLRPESLAFAECSTIRRRANRNNAGLSASGLYAGGVRIRLSPMRSAPHKTL